MSDGRPVIVIVTESAALLGRARAAAEAAGACPVVLPVGFYRHAYARTLLAAGPGCRPAGAVIDVQAGVADPYRLAEQLGASGVPALLVVPHVREETVRRATRGGTILGVLTHGEGVGGELRERLGRMVRIGMDAR